MSHLSVEERTTYVRGMFARIARRYDLLNRLMTFGQDLHWRREAVQRLELTRHARVLDLGAGTGDLGFELHRREPTTEVIAADITPEMMRIGMQRPGGDRVSWLVADALHLPFANQSMDGVISAFLLRNVTDVPLALQEQQRVLQAGGRFVSLDTCPPPKGFLNPLIQIYFRIVIPLLGRLIVRDAEAYTYLPQSTQRFLSPPQLAEAIQHAGLQDVEYQRRMFGTIAIHWAQKP